MEKKEISYKFIMISLINIIPCWIFGGGLTVDTIFFIGALIVLILNHYILTRVVKTLTVEEGGGENALRKSGAKILGFIFIKMLLLIGLVGTFFYFKPSLILKLFLLIFFQLIIQILSIKYKY